MYAQGPFRIADGAEAAELMRASPLATLCLNGPDGPIAAQAPLVGEVGPDGALVALTGHIARANPFWRGVGPEGAPALVLFRGEDAYVSPSAYPSKAAHGRVVPTWNYLAVEVRGVLTVETDPERMDPYLRQPTEMMEAGRARPWSVDDAPADYLAAMARGVVGIRIAVASVEAMAKLSQNRDAADLAGVIADFETREDPAARSLAALMRQERTTA